MVLLYKYNSLLNKLTRQVYELAVPYTPGFVLWTFFFHVRGPTPPMWVNNQRYPLVVNSSSQEGCRAGNFFIKGLKSQSELFAQK